MYRDRSPESDERKERAEAEQWQYDGRFERAAELRADRPDEYDKLPPSVKMSLAFYLTGKAAAERAGRDVTR